LRAVKPWEFRYKKLVFYDKAGNLMRNLSYFPAQKSDASAEGISRGGGWRFLQERTRSGGSGRGAESFRKAFHVSRVVALDRRSWLGYLNLYER
jgi:hypothetical protein